MHSNLLCGWYLKEYSNSLQAIADRWLLTINYFVSHVWCMEYYVKNNVPNYMACMHAKMCMNGSFIIHDRTFSKDYGMVFCHHWMKSNGIFHKRIIFKSSLQALLIAYFYQEKYALVHMQSWYDKPPKITIYL